MKTSASSNNQHTLEQFDHKPAPENSAEQRCEFYMNLLQVNKIRFESAVLEKARNMILGYEIENDDLKEKIKAMRDEAKLRDGLIEFQEHSIKALECALHKKSFWKKLFT